MMEFRPENLDSATRSYLAEVWAKRGVGVNGVFVPRGRAGAWFGLVFGLLLVGAALVMVLPGFHSDGRAIIQTVLAAVGALSLGYATSRIAARRSDAYLGDFLFVDSLHVWDVGSECVTAAPLNGLTEARGTHHITNGTYQFTAVTANLGPDGTWNHNINGRPLAERLVIFLNALAAIRKPGAAGEAPPSAELAAAMAERFSQGQKEFSISPQELLRKIPSPAAERQGGPPRKTMPWIAAAAAAGVAALALPPINGLLYDEDLYARAVADTGVGSADWYLQALPEGRHAAEVLALRDDRLFAAARADAEQNAGPGAVRRYLSDARNTLHRDEAQALINGFYDQAVVRIREQAKGGAADRPLFKGLLGLLEALKTAERPVVTVGFKSSFDAVPATPLAKTNESANHKLYSQSEPEVKAIADKSPDKTAILAPGGAFESDQVSRREAVILARLKESVEKMLGADILTFEPVQGGAEPMLLVAYHTYPTGDLLLWTQTGGGAIPLFRKRTVRGLVRKYLFDWTITIRPPGKAEPTVFKLTSSPAESLHYRNQPQDPGWAPYAVVMYSAFYDLSGRMIREFGLQPPPAPNSFSFNDAVGSVDNTPIGGPRPVLPPGFPAPPKTVAPKRDAEPPVNRNRR
jgi:hypothetical protein